MRTLHGETNVPKWLVEAVRTKTKKTWWLPFPALKANIKKTGFKTFIADLLRQKLGRSQAQKKRKKDGRFKPLPHVIQLQALKKKLG